MENHFKNNFGEFGTDKFFGKHFIVSKDKCNEFICFYKKISNEKLNELIDKYLNKYCNAVGFNINSGIIESDGTLTFHQYLCNGVVFDLNFLFSKTPDKIYNWLNSGEITETKAFVFYILFINELVRISDETN